MMLRGYTARVVIRKHHINYTECGDDNNVNFRMPEEPEQMVKQNNISTVGVVKESSVPMTV